MLKSGKVQKIFWEGKSQILKIEVTNDQIGMWWTLKGM